MAVDNLPPTVEDITHKPDQPRSDDDVLIETKIEDSDGVSVVNLFYQLVMPGVYIRINDAAYAKKWTRMLMGDDGQGADRVAGDMPQRSCR